MESLEFNKIAGAILTAGVVAMVSGFISDLIFKKHHEVEIAYSIAPSEPKESAAAPEAPAIQPVAELLASANAENGVTIAKKCATCHTFDSGGPNKIGPNLYDVVNRKIASHEGFSYSSALQEKSSESWTFEHLNTFIAKPKAWAPGTKMSFAGLNKAEDRADLLLYLRSLSANPAPLP